jgi:hypothetical protein
MTNDEIKQLAIECGFILKYQNDDTLDLNHYVYLFAKEIIAAEREACAKVCEAQVGLDDRTMAAINEVAFAIRARGEKCT